MANLAIECHVLMVVSAALRLDMQGDTVFVLQDASPGNYIVVDPDGRLGEVRCTTGK